MNAPQSIDHWIDGTSTNGDGTGSSKVYDPATGQVTGTVALASPGDVDRAVASAGRAYESWRRASLAERSSIMFRFRHLVDARREDLARLISAQHGKVFADALGEVQRGLEVVEYACGIPTLLKGEITTDVS
ncbi:MAG: aldehyde dehydrogenase family protein, partial [Acidimicrobiales bacterium]